MTGVDLTQPLEVAHVDGRVLSATLVEDNGIGHTPIAIEGALFSVSLNSLPRLGWTLQNKS